MMKLSTMWNVHRLDSADGRNPLADQLLERWAYDPGSEQLFRASANSVFIFRHEGKRCFLRFADSGERARETIEVEMDLVRWLAGMGMNVATPIPSRNWQDVETVATAWGTFHAVALVGLNGVHVDIGELDHAGFRAWGSTLGRLHQAMRAYAGPARTARSTWQDQLTSASRQLVDDEAVVRNEIDQVASALGTLPVDDHRYGLIHGDFELDNLCWHDSTVGVLDFDDSVRSWFVADIAFALRGLFGDFGDGMDLRNEYLQSFVEGYATQHVLDADLLARLPTFRRLGNIIRYARLVRAVDLADAPEHPEWLRGLRRKLLNLVESYKASFRRHRR